jgi:hypothetical protein
MWSFKLGLVNAPRWQACKLEVASWRRFAGIPAGTPRKRRAPAFRTNQSVIYRCKPRMLGSMAAVALLVTLLLAASLGGLAERVCHPDAWHTRLDIRGPDPWRLVDYEAHSAAQQARHGQTCEPSALQTSEGLCFIAPLWLKSSSNKFAWAVLVCPLRLQLAREPGRRRELGCATHDRTHTGMYMYCSQAFEEMLPQVTEAIIRDGHIPQGAKLERRGLLPLEGCYRTADPAADDQHSVGQFGFYFIAPFTHVGARRLRCIAAGAGNSSTAGMCACPQQCSGCFPTCRRGGSMCGASAFGRPTSTHIHTWRCSDTVCTPKSRCIDDVAWSPSCYFPCASK